jgi:hypothetical protein
MASKFSKFLFFTAATAAATATVYYLVKKNEAGQKAAAGTDDDDFEVYDEDLDAEPKGRSYVSLNLDNVESALSKAKEVISDSYQHVKDTVKAGLETASGGMRDFVDLTREGSDDVVADGTVPEKAEPAEKAGETDKKAAEKPEYKTAKADTAEKKAEDKADAPEKKAEDKADKDEKPDRGFRKGEYRTAKVEPAPEPAKADPPKAEPPKAEPAEKKTPPPDDYSDLEEAGTPLIIDPEPEKEKEKTEGFFDEEAEEEPEDEWASLDREYASFKK